MLSTHALKIACSACGTKVLTTILLVTKLSAALHFVVFEAIEISHFKVAAKFGAYYVCTKHLSSILCLEKTDEFKTWINSVSDIAKIRPNRTSMPLALNQGSSFGQFGLIRRNWVCPANQMYFWQSTLSTGPLKWISIFVWAFNTGEIRLYEILQNRGGKKGQKISEFSNTLIWLVSNVLFKKCSGCYDFVFFSKKAKDLPLLAEVSRWFEL